MKKSSNQTYTSGIPVGLKPYFSLITFIALFLLLSTTTFAQPNNDCNNATPIPALDGSCNPFNTTGASFDLFNGDCTAGTNNIWFSFVAQGPDLIVQAAGGTFVPEITVVQFNPTPCDFGSATQLGCSVINELGVNGLIPGNTYYILVTPSDNVGGAFNLCVNNPLPPVGPPNDDACNAIPLNANGSCQTGTTTDATIDYVNPDPACTAATNENAVWYTVTLSGANNGLDVNLISLGLTGDVGVLIGTLNPCNATTMLINEAYCGPPTTVTAAGLTIGETYYIQV
ncbi:MAG: hypothetical protein AB8G15_19805, partial [Saprospiraceae bacterium]